MENNNQPPFAVGQKIVRTGPTASGIVNHGDIVTVSILDQCPDCGNWKVNCVEFPSPPQRTPRSCACGFLGQDSGIYFGRCEFFAPLNPPRVSAIPELLKAPVEETLDVHPVKILTDVL